MPNNRRATHQPSTVRFRWRTFRQYPWWIQAPLNLAMMAMFTLMCTAPFWAWVAGN